MQDWNHNSAYFPLVRRAARRVQQRRGPDGLDVLDVGCGDGQLARSLAGPHRRVLGLDPSAAMVELARERHAGVAGLEFRQGAFLEQGFAPASFDLVSFVASLHHMDEQAALAHAAELLRPGGRLVVVGLAANRSPGDWILSALRLPLVRFNNLRPDYATAPGMPIAQADLSWHEVRALARRALPGVRYRRRLYYRYSLEWAAAHSAGTV